MEKLKELKIETLIYLLEYFEEKHRNCHNYQFIDILGLSVISGEEEKVKKYDVILNKIELELELRLLNMLN